MKEFDWTLLDQSWDDHWLHNMWTDIWNFDFWLNTNHSTIDLFDSISWPDENHAYFPSHNISTDKFNRSMYIPRRNISELTWYIIQSQRSETDERFSSNGPWYFSRIERRSVGRNRFLIVDRNDTKRIRTSIWKMRTSPIMAKY